MIASVSLFSTIAIFFLSVESVLISSIDIKRCRCILEFVAIPLTTQESYEEKHSHVMYSHTHFRAVWHTQSLPHTPRLHNSINRVNIFIVNTRNVFRISRSKELLPSVHQLLGDSADLQCGISYLIH